MKLSEFKETIEESKNQQTDNEYNKKVEGLYDKYKDMNQNELMSELLNQVETQKKNGTFNFNQLKNSVDKILPFLNDEQKNNLLSILQKLK